MANNRFSSTRFDVYGLANSNVGNPFIRGLRSIEFMWRLTKLNQLSAMVQLELRSAC